MAFKSGKVETVSISEEGSSSPPNWCFFGWLLALTQLLLHGALGLVLFWVIYYLGGFGWQDQPKLEFNYHPVLMIGGFVYLSGNALLSYRSFGCCRHIYKKLFHTVFHILAVPAIVMGFITVWDSRNLSVPPIANFWSLHSWMGLTTMGLFAIQVVRTLVVGFFSFLILLCCEARTAALRAALVPVHATFGLITFLMAIATCLTGITEKAINSLGDWYTAFPPEGLVVNVLGATLMGLAILMPVLMLIRCQHRGPSSISSHSSGDHDEESERL
ncbi:plasma membrane ascorbate-dependent reductase CYBRD1-like isoform X1 [Daphnia pulex]|uniref:plasma membrane ascorbate-dependent reductase CYBRD1-like isoform X1 n=1 Tax=Daphnia pulex TaxID=6669 RepID=UPI001EE08FF9|nr:plasma membrane ascorbate-dependent reductase CYBRD1-like isoform X1 [Daphnia pulex]